MSNAPVLTNPPNGQGRPRIADEQFMQWLILMQPFLIQGASLNYAMQRADLLSHEFSIRDKYKSSDPADVWFSRKVNMFRSQVGELINSVGYNTVKQVHNRMVETDGKVSFLNPIEAQVWKTMAEKHRSAQPFFVTRVESGEADDSKLGKIIETMEHTDYDDVAGEAQKQMVATNPPVQNQGQAGAAGNVQTQPDAIEASS